MKISKKVRKYLECDGYYDGKFISYSIDERCGKTYLVRIIHIFGKNHWIEYVEDVTGKYKAW